MTKGSILFVSVKQQTGCIKIKLDNTQNLEGPSNEGLCSDKQLTPWKLQHDRG